MATNVNILSYERWCEVNAAFDNWIEKDRQRAYETYRFHLINEDLSLNIRNCAKCHKALKPTDYYHSISIPCGFGNIRIRLCDIDYDELFQVQV